MTREERKLYNSWSKEQIYDAYLSEHSLRQQQKKEINTLQDRLAYIKYVVYKAAGSVKELKNHFKSL